MNYPSMQDVYTQLTDIVMGCIEEQWDDSEGIEVRLQVTRDGWGVHFGDPGYDTDHSGVWGATTIRTDATQEEFVAAAEYLIEQCRDMAA